MKKIFFIILLLSALNIFATSYYIDPSAGNDSNAGTSTGLAWQHLPNDPNATGVAASLSASAGDIFNVKGGSKMILSSGLNFCYPVGNNGTLGNEN